MRRFVRALLASAALLAAGLAAPAAAQPAYGYDAPPPPSRRAVGYNCDAVQRGLSGPQPYSCPMPGPRPLGARCFCDVPIAPFSPPQPPAPGRVVP
ncbi:conserved hypothetical protein [Methylobacterium sp. 4-46]|uniref:hypothetical protein n=1 Tax=unclassified Methylobacterium TaxID=2615210 RepID=UPI000165C5A0|nr:MULTISPECIES: hypothetical protein [Methylobacterium]ACA17358.1 conserved hypothetical protein [Methylobacterium sp. 4-46]WFT83045.1 hypothetical protein QA634_14955 [Methylobacterium nodulans]